MTLELLNLPKEMITCEINKWLLELDRQLLRKVSKYFNDIFPFPSINFNDIDLQIVHLARYKKLWDGTTMDNLAKWGRLECLKYARSQGYPWDTLTTTNAALGGHLECL